MQSADIRVQENHNTFGLCGKIFPDRIRSPSLTARVAGQGHDEDEDVDDVKVELESSGDIFFWLELEFPSSEELLGIIGQELKYRYDAVTQGTIF